MYSTPESTTGGFEDQELAIKSTTMQLPDPAAVDLNSVLGYMYFYLTAVMSILSIVGSLVIIFTYIYFKDIRTVCRKLLVFLSIADCLTALGNFLGIMWYYNRDNMGEKSMIFFCEFHAALTFFSSISSFLWTVAIALYLYISIVKKSSRTADTLLPGFHVVCWLIPCTIAIVAWSMGVIGYDKGLELPSWCWINPETPAPGALFWQYLTGKAWEMSSYVIVVILYTLIKLTLRQQIKARKNMSTSGGSNVILEANKKLTFVPAVYIVTRMWGTLRHILGAHFHQYVNGYAVAWIVPLQGIGDSAQGFANCVLFCLMTKTLRNRIRRMCCPCYNLTGPEETSTHIASPET